MRLRVETKVAQIVRNVNVYAALTEGVLRAMLLTKVRAAAAALLLCGVAVAGTALVASGRQSPDQNKESSRPEKPPTAKVEEADAEPTPRAADPAKAEEPVSYVRVKVKGKLIRKKFSHRGSPHCIETTDAIFPRTEVLVILQRSEDKDRDLTAYLEAREGQTVIVEGWLDCRFLDGDKSDFDGEKRILVLHLRSKKQVRALHQGRARS